MDGTPPSLSPAELYSRLGTAAAPLLVDVRPPDVFDADDRMIIGSARRYPAEIDRWCSDIPVSRAVVAYCADGRHLGRAVALALRGTGIDAGYLAGGMQAWKVGRFPTRRKPDGADAKWVTRERPKIDRIACPWLVSRFINPDAEFFYVPADDVADVATMIGGVPYDISRAAFGHAGEQCSFDAIMAAYDVRDPALARLAMIVRGADTSRPDLTPQCEGLLAISHGLSANFANDHEMLGHGLVVYDALYAWCRMQAKEAG